MKHIIFLMLFGTATLVAGTIPSTISYAASPTVEAHINEGVSAPKQGVKAATSTPPTTTGIKALVEAEFGKNSIMVRVASCESQFRQFDKTGDVLRGIVNSKDVGVLQINEHYHLASALDMGLDIHTVTGNLKYAHFLYNSQGTAPWTASKACWA